MLNIMLTFKFHICELICQALHNINLSTVKELKWIFNMIIFQIMHYHNFFSICFIKILKSHEVKLQTIYTHIIHISEIWCKMMNIFNIKILLLFSDWDNTLWVHLLFFSCFFFLYFFSSLISWFQCSTSC